MDFSIIIPAYNSEKTIKQAVDSIEAVQYDNMEIILVDDGSTDSTHEKCKQIIDTYHNVSYYYQQNAGVSAARNYGVQHAKGKYVLFFDSDDTVDPPLLKKCMIRALEQDVDMLVFGAVFQRCYNGIVFQIDNMRCENEELIVQSDYPVRLSGLFDINYLSSVWNKILKREICKEVCFNPDKRMFEDCLFSLEYIRFCISIYIMPDLAYVYRIEYCSEQTRGKRINDLQLYMNDFQEALLALEKRIGRELPELRSRIELVYNWILQNKLSSSSIQELRNIDSTKMMVTLFNRNCIANSKVAKLFFGKRFVLLRLYSIFGNLHNSAVMKIKCLKNKHTPKGNNT